MKISNCATQYIGFSNPPIHKNNLSPKYNKDILEISTIKTNPAVSFKGGFFRSLFQKVNQAQAAAETNNNAQVTKFHQSLAQGLKDTVEIDIPAKNLTSIMSPEEFRELISTACEDNFTAKEGNLDGTYFIDLDYESNYTKSKKENIFDILDNISAFADKYYERTGKKFVFALTDVDTLDSVKHAIRIIGDEPQKFKNVRFVPGIKISYAHQAPNSNLDYENCNFLLYGINPFSDNLSSFIENTTQKRKKMLLDFIRKVNQLYPEFAYTIKEFVKQNKIKYDKDICISNLYWRAREYAETKGETAMKSIKKVPESIISEAEDIISQLGKVYVGNNSDLMEGPDSKIIKQSELNSTIKGVFEQYSTHVNEQGKLVSAAENLFNDLIACLYSEEHRPIIAYAAPYYLCHDFDSQTDIDNNEYPNTVKYMKEMKEKSRDMLIAFQSVVPMYEYNTELSKERINKFNDYVRQNSDLYEVGGSFDKYYQTTIS